MKIKNILLIDDNFADNYIHQDVLAELNIAENITVKNSAMDALAYLQELNEFPEIIFLDIRMPKMDGLEFLAAYDELPAKKKERCAIFMVTTSSNPSDLDKAGQHSYVKGYMNKPLTAETVTEILNPPTAAE